MNVKNNDNVHECVSREYFNNKFNFFIKRVMETKEIPLHIKDQDLHKKNDWRLKDIEITQSLRQVYSDTDKLKMDLNNCKIS
jgi:hypothetical protein